MIDAEPLFGAPDQPGATRDFHVFPRNGRPRWMLEARFSRPWHLETWPRANLRARAIYALAWALSRVGIRLPARRVAVRVASGSLYETLTRDHDRLGIFLGTPGPSRKIVVYAGSGQRSEFIKIPLGEESSRLIEHEARALELLATDPDIAELIPATRRIGGCLALENVADRGAAFRELAPPALARIHDLLFARSSRTVTSGALRAAWIEAAGAQAPSVQTAEVHSPATRQLIAECRAAADALLDQLGPDTPVACYEAHGDFTRWNVLVTRDGEPRIIDWEMFGEKPRYFDVIHYFVSGDLLVRRLAPDQILTHLDQIGVEIGAGDDWRLSVGLYLSYQALHYTAIYEAQTELFVQAIWQMEGWRDALRAIRLAASQVS